MGFLVGSMLGCNRLPMLVDPPDDDKAVRRRQRRSRARRNWRSYMIEGGMLKAGRFPPVTGG